MDRAVTAAGTTVWLVRHGETRSYEADAGLTPRGVEQAYRRGVALADAVGSVPVTLLTARSARARETARHLRRGLTERLAGAVPAPQDRAEFDNFHIATPSGPREPTAAFAEYAAARERHGRDGSGPPPGWVAETGRFWAEQDAGGDPIRFWLTVPLLAFEPPAVCVRRFWRGLAALPAGAGHVVVTSHSGPIRAFATAALGRDLGEPDNAEAVVVRVAGDGRVATVTYRGRSEEVRVPDGGTTG